jgi:hypothetical protein
VSIWNTWGPIQEPILGCTWKYILSKYPHGMKRTTKDSAGKEAEQRWRTKEVEKSGETGEARMRVVHDGAVKWGSTLRFFLSGCKERLGIYWWIGRLGVREDLERLGNILFFWC